MIDRILMIIGIALYRCGLANLVTALGGRNAKVLLFHDVADAESLFVKGLGTTLAPATFATHIAYLTRHYDIVPIERLTERGAKPRVAIAFDDGYRSVALNAVPVLRQFEAPAIIYLITRAVGNHALVWVNELNWLLQNCGEDGLAVARKAYSLPDDASPADVISAARIGFDRTRIDTLIASLNALAPEPAVAAAARERLYLDWDEIRALTRDGIAFGNHTATHPNMALLSDKEQRAEIEEARQEMAKNDVDTVHFAYPFGHHNDRTAAIARSLGMTWIAEVGGDNRVADSRDVGRVDVQAESTAALFAQIEVVEPVKAALRRWTRRPKAGWGPLPAANSATVHSS